MTNTSDNHQAPTGLRPLEITYVNRMVIMEKLTNLNLKIEAAIQTILMPERQITYTQIERLMNEVDEITSYLLNPR